MLFINFCVHILKDMAKKPCPQCAGLSMNWAKLCYGCKNKGVVFVPDPTSEVVLISYPKTVDEERTVLEKLQKFRKHPHIRVLSSTAHNPAQVASGIAQCFGVEVELYTSLKAGKSIRRSAAYDIVKQDPTIGLFIIVTHAPVVRLSRNFFYTKLYSVNKPASINVAPGDIIYIHGTSMSKL